MKKMKRILSAAMVLLLMTTLPITAFAEEYNIDEGSITVSADSTGQYVTQVGGVQNYQQTTETVITQTDSSTATTNTVTINAADGAEANVTLDGVDITARGAAVSTTGEGDVTIELDNSNELQSGYGRAGLEKNNTGTLTITDTDNNGSLDATGGNFGAGIGGGSDGDGSNITITGGTVTAIGGGAAAGIGGGSGAHGENITITDGTVTAIGGGAAAGIGGGSDAHGENITITDGKVTAIGGGRGAGIGGGTSGNGNNITITGGEITATGGDYAAGIGGGYRGDGSNIKVWDEAQLKAQGGGDPGDGAGAAVGNGGTISNESQQADGAEVIVDTSELTANGKIEYYAPGVDMSRSTPTKTVTGTHEHNWNNGEVTKEATCVETGVMTYTCIAGNDFTRTEEIAATGNHNIVIDPAVAATCTSTGLTAGQHCTTCTTQTVEQQEVAKLEHNIVIDPAVAPTYTSTGLTEGSHCTTCDTMTIKQEIVPMLERPAETESDATQSAPLYRVTDKDGKNISYKTEQKDGVLTITVDADFAILTGTLSGINTLKAQGVEKIVFVTKDATSTFALANLLEKGSLGEIYKLTHDGKTVTFTLGTKNTDVSGILEKA